MRRTACVLGAVTFAWSAMASAAPSVPDDPVAREELKTGYELAQSNRCGDAIPHLNESLKRDPRAVTLLNLADCEEKIGHLADAMVHWGDARARAAASGEKPIEAEAATRADALDARLPHLTISVSKNAPADTTVERDGIVLGAPSLGVSLPVDPGTHTVIVRASGRQDVVKKVTIGEGEKQVLDLTAGPPLEPPTNVVDTSKSSRTLSPLVPVGFGVGAAGLIVGAITGAMTLSKGSTAKAHCTGGDDKTCDSQSAYDAAQSGKTLGAVSTVSFIVGGAGVAVGVVGLFLGKKKEPSNVYVGLGLGNLLVRGRF